MGVLFIVDGGGFYNGKAFNESWQGMKGDHESIPNFKVREGWCINFRGWWQQGARNDKLQFALMWFGQNLSCLSVV